MKRGSIYTVLAVAAVLFAAGCGPSKPPPKYRVVLSCDGKAVETWTATHKPNSFGEQRGIYFTDAVSGGTIWVQPGNQCSTIVTEIGGGE